MIMNADINSMVPAINVNSPSTPFSASEVLKIHKAKTDLELIISGTGIFETCLYDIGDQKTIKKPCGDVFKSNLVIAGGVISSLLLNETINDIDVFVLNMNIDMFHTLIREKTGTWVVKYFLDEEDDPRADDYKNPHIFATATNPETKIQYVLTDHKNRKELLADFDYLHATASYHNGKLFINRETYDAIGSKTLVVQNKSKQIKRHREEKFVSRGWKTEIDRMVDQPSKTLKEILQDKLTNVRTNGWTAPAQLDVKSKWASVDDTKAVHGADITNEDIMHDLMKSYDDVDDMLKSLDSVNRST